MNHDDDDDDDEAPGPAREAACRLVGYLGWRYRRTREEAAEPDWDDFHLGNGINVSHALDALLARLAEEPERREAFGVRWDDRGHLVGDCGEPEPAFLAAWSKRADEALREEELLEVWDGNWNQHPRVPLEDWVHEVRNDDTRQGYWSYVESKLVEWADERDRQNREK